MLNNFFVSVFNFAHFCTGHSNLVLNYRFWLLIRILACSFTITEDSRGLQINVDNMLCLHWWIIAWDAWATKTRIIAKPFRLISPRFPQFFTLSTPIHNVEKSPIISLTFLCIFPRFLSWSISFPFFTFWLPGTSNWNNYPWFLVPRYYSRQDFHRRIFVALSLVYLSLSLYFPWFSFS